MTGFAAKTQVVIARKSIASLSDTGFLIEQAFAALALGQLLVDIDDVGVATAFLVTPYGRRMTGSTFYVDAGLNIMA